MPAGGMYCQLYMNVFAFKREQFQRTKNKLIYYIMEFCRCGFLLSAGGVQKRTHIFVYLHSQGPLETRLVLCATVHAVCFCSLLGCVVSLCRVSN